MYHLFCQLTSIVIYILLLLDFVVNNIIHLCKFVNLLIHHNFIFSCTICIPVVVAISKAFATMATTKRVDRVP